MLTVQKMIAFQIVSPLKKELLLAMHLIGLHSAADIPSMREAFEMHHDRARRIHDLHPVLADLECQVCILAICRDVTLVETSEAFEHVLAQQDRGTRTVVHLF